MVDVSETSSEPDLSDPDRDAIRTLLGSKSWEEQLQTARLLRAKVLADREHQDQKAGRSAPGGAKFALAQMPDWLPHTASHTAQATPPQEPARRDVPIAQAVPAATARRVALGLGLGVAAGLLIGLLAHPLLYPLVAQPVIARANLLPDQGPTNTSSSIIADRQAPVGERAAPRQADPVPGMQRATLVAPSSLSYGQFLAASANPTTTVGRDVSLSHAVFSTAEPPVEAVLTYPASYYAGDAPLSLDGRVPDLFQTASGPITVPPDLPSLSVPVIDFGYIPPPRAMLPEMQYGQAMVPGLSVPKTRSNDGLAPPPVPLLKLTTSRDAAPEAHESVYIAGAGSHLINLHLAPADSGLDQRAQLLQLGFADVSVKPSAFVPSQTMVAFYHAQDAKAATSLAGLYGGAALDLTGFTPTPDAGILDLYLAR